MSKEKTEDLTPDEMIIHFQSLQDTLAVSLEFKRMLDIIFVDPAVKELDVLQKYKEHYMKHFHKYRVYRTAFGDVLSKRLENLDSSHLTHCFNPNCKLPSCTNRNPDFSMSGPIQDNISEVSTKKAKQAELIQTKLNDEVNKNTDVSQKDANEKAVDVIILNQVTKKDATTNTDAENASSVDHKNGNISGDLTSNSQLSQNSSPTEQFSLKNKSITNCNTSDVLTIRCKTEDCKLVFKSRSESVEHYRKHGLLYKCSHCDKLFSVQINLWHHFLTHDE